MSRSKLLALPLPVVLRRDKNAPYLHYQITDSIRTCILEEALLPGDALPAMRTLANQLKVSRITVETAYAMLAEQGYIVSKSRSGMRVAASLPGVLPPAVPTIKPAPEDDNQRLHNLSHRAKIAGKCATLLPQQNLPLAVVAPCEALSPGKSWSRIVSRLSQKPWLHATYDGACGFAPLKAAICEYARRTRGVRCNPEQIIITSGAQQAFSLCCDVLFDPGDVVFTEDPCYPILFHTLLSRDLNVISCPLDSEGIITDVPDGMPIPKGIFVTPSHQYPLGMAMSLERRTSLLLRAKETGAWIIEDDYDSELNYDGRPVLSLQGLETSGQTVVYVGTFSKMLFPGIRVGYLIAPAGTESAFTQAKLLADRQTNSLMQLTLAEFIGDGHYESHIRRIRTLYMQRRSVLIYELRTQLAGFGRVIPSSHGMHVVFAFSGGINDVQIAAALKHRQVESRALSPMYNVNQTMSGLVLGFGGFEPDAIRDAVRIISDVLVNMAAS